MMKNLFFTILITIAFNIYAQDRPAASIKVEYDEWINTENTNTGKPLRHSEKYILQIAEGISYYYNPQTYFVDSLENDPNGKAALELAWEDAYREMMNGGRNSYDIMKEKGFTHSSRRKILKRFPDKIIDVWNTNMGDSYYYPVEMSDLTWELGDSVKNILGYECNLAIADYHGRKWHAWFATDIAAQDGPWQLCGLPGLILSAETEDGKYGFTAIGIQTCNEPLKERYIKEDRVFKTKRLAYLRMKEYTIRNRSTQISAMTGGKVTPKNADYKGKTDFIETDYHE